MARSSSKAAKKRDPRRPEEWPVSEFPYVIYKPGADPHYFRTLKAAINHELKGISKVRTQFSNLGVADTLKAVDRVTAKLRSITDQTLDAVMGATIIEVIDPYSSMRYRMNIVRRREV